MKEEIKLSGCNKIKMKPSEKILTDAYKRTNNSIDLLSGKEIDKDIKVTLDNLYTKHIELFLIIENILKYLDENEESKKKFARKEIKLSGIKLNK